MAIRFLIQKEFLQMRRNAFMPKIIFVFPIMVMCVMPWVMNMEVKNIVVDVVDNARTTESQRLVRRIEASPYFVFGGQQPSYQEALRHVEHGRTDVILTINDDGEKLVAANAVNGTKGALGVSYLSQVIASDPSLSPVAVPGCSFLYNPHQDYKVFMIPALMGILLMMLCGFLPALNIVGEKESGTIEQINVTPVSKWTFILAKLIPYWMVGLLVMTVCFVLSWAVYGITCAGPLWLVYVLAVLVALFFSALGLIVSNYSDTMQQAMLVMWFFVVCLMLLSGLFTPVRSMPQWAYATTWVNPMHYFIDAIRTVWVRGGGVTSVAHEVLALSFFATAASVWAVWSYRKRN